MNIWIGFSYLSTIFFAIEDWFEQIFNAIQQNGLLNFLIVISGIVILFWIVRTAGLHISVGSDRVPKGDTRK